MNKVQTEIESIAIFVNTFLQIAKCFIDGQCFNEGQENPDNKGEVCDSTKDVENWTVNSK